MSTMSRWIFVLKDDDENYRSIFSVGSNFSNRMYDFVNAKQKVSYDDHKPNLITPKSKIKRANQIPVGQYPLTKKSK